MSKNGKMTELEKVRRKHGLTKRQLSDLLSVSELSIHRWCYGLARPQPHLQRRLDVLLETLKEAHSE